MEQDGQELIIHAQFRASPHLRSMLCYYLIACPLALAVVVFFYETGELVPLRWHDIDIYFFVSLPMNALIWGIPVTAFVFWPLILITRALRRWRMTGRPIIRLCTGRLDDLRTGRSYNWLEIEQVHLRNHSLDALSMSGRGGAFIINVPDKLVLKIVPSARRGWQHIWPYVTFLGVDSDGPFNELPRTGNMLTEVIGLVQYYHERAWADAYKDQLKSEKEITFRPARRTKAVWLFFAVMFCLCSYLTLAHAWMLQHNTQGHEMHEAGPGFKELEQRRQAMPELDRGRGYWPDYYTPMEKIFEDGAEELILNLCLLLPLTLFFLRRMVLWVPVLSSRPVMVFTRDGLYLPYLLRTPLPWGALSQNHFLLSRFALEINTRKIGDISDAWDLKLDPLPLARPVTRGRIMFLPHWLFGEPMALVVLACKIWSEEIS